MQPETIGPYRVERELGQGGMGTVFFGVHEDTGQKAAIKVLPAQLSREVGFLERFNREIDALHQLSNPHIVRLYESGVEGDTYFFAMEYVDGVTLTEYLSEHGRLPWREVIDLSIQICSALKAAHQAGIIHRDLKPANLLIDEAGTLKLADFGVAQIFASGKLTATGGVVGTAEYMSPEQARGQRVTKKSDLYSLGCVMYTMLVGKPPFMGSDQVDILHKHQYGLFDKPARFLDDLPSWLDQIVCQLLEKNPEKRFPDAHVVGRRLQEVVKKVELSQSEQTMTSAGRDQVESERQEVGPTLMRDMVRAEVERTQYAGPVARFFDNIWVLLLMLAAIIAGGFWWFQDREVPPEQLFEQGVQLMEQPAGADWIEAREDFFAPLLEQDEAAWKERVQPYLEQIELYELERSLISGRRKRSQGSEPIRLSEPERILQLAIAYREIGDNPRAKRLLTALESLPSVDESQETVRRLARQQLDDIAESSDQSTREFIGKLLLRSQELLESGRKREAAEIWKSLIQLYGDNESVSELIEEARRSLENSDAIESPDQANSAAIKPAVDPHKQRENTDGS